MKKVLITGFTGFVSKYLIKALYQTGIEYEILGISRQSTYDVHYESLNIRVLKVDLNDRKYVEDILGYFKPDFIFHLASNSSVSYSWQNPVSSFQNNTNIFLNLIESVRILKLKCRILSVGSSEEYGIVNPDNIPLSENAPLNPVSPYAVARLSQELLSKVYAQGYGMDIVLTRSFNHIGPGQKDTFVISSFAKQVAEVKYGYSKFLTVGNLNLIRDFLDVRDVVKAYILLMNKGISGEVYNICSGTGYSLHDILQKFKSLSGIGFEVKVSNELLRPADNPIIIGCNAKIKVCCQWSPAIQIDTSLDNLLEFWIKEYKKDKPFSLSPAEVI